MGRWTIELSICHGKYPENSRTYDYSVVTMILLQGERHEVRTYLNRKSRTVIKIIIVTSLLID